LNGALDFSEAAELHANPLWFVQIPHHGSRHNVDVDLLNRMLGQPGEAEEDSVTAFASASEKDEHHPHSMVLNAFKRRGCRIASTEGQSIRHNNGGPNREGYTTLEPLPWYSEDEG
jgi:beta-lactamase superfamily II metal-dependent hydrolase